MRHAVAIVKKRNDGKGAEKLVTEALDLAVRKHRVAYVRLYDSTSAGIGSGGNFIPEQPSDFIVTMEGKAFLLEVKSSNHLECLSQSVLRNVFSDNQIMGARLWKRAGANAVCAFYSLATKRFDFWMMEDITMAYLAPARQRKLNKKPRASSTSDALAMVTTMRDLI